MHNFYSVQQMSTLRNCVFISKILIIDVLLSPWILYTFLSCKQNLTKHGMIVFVKKVIQHNIYMQPVSTGIEFEFETFV